MATVVNTPNKEDIFQIALQYLGRCEYRDFRKIHETSKARHFRCMKNTDNYFVRVCADLRCFKRWGPRRGELLVQTAKDPRIRKIEARFFLTSEGRIATGEKNVLMVVDVFPFIEGESLSHYIKRNPQLKIDKVLEIAIPIAEQILSLHRERIVHRDIKPMNIMLDCKGIPYLMDNEFAKCNGLKEPLTPLGTIHYMPPEILNKPLQKNDDLFKLDSFSFGLTLFEMICGMRFREQKMRAFSEGTEELDLDKHLDNKCDLNIKELIKGLLQRDPRGRMSMSDALQALKAYQALRAAAKSTPDEKE